MQLEQNTSEKEKNDHKPNSTAAQSSGNMAKPMANLSANKPADMPLDSQYLINNIGHILTDAITEICEKRPWDPIEYLALYLKQYALHKYLKEKVMFKCSVSRLYNRFAAALLNRGAINHVKMYCIISCMDGGNYQQSDFDHITPEKEQVNILLYYTLFLRCQYLFSVHSERYVSTHFLKTKGGGGGGDGQELQNIMRKQCSHVSCFSFFLC